MQTELPIAVMPGVPPLLGGGLCVEKPAGVSPPPLEADRTEFQESGGQAEKIDQPIDRPRRTFKQTHLGNAERLVARHGPNLRYCHAWNKWVIFTGPRWQADDSGEIERLATETVRSIYSEASMIEDSDHKVAITKHARKSEARNEIEAMIALARSQAGVPVAPGELDKDPLLFNCLNGTIDLRTGELRPHRREDLITKLGRSEYDPAASCPVWTGCLDLLMGGNAELVEYLQRIFGYALTGQVTEKAMFVFHGKGDNAKTTLVETIRAIAGDYAGIVDIDVLMQNGQDAARERAIADLVGKRFVTSSEAEEGQRLNEAKIKQLTGMGRQIGRRIYGSPFEFDPHFKLFIDANHKPVIRGTDHAIWNRIRLVPFLVSIPKHQQDRDFGKKLKAELPGILAWVVRGAVAWYRGGLGTPRAVSEAGKQYRQEMDLVAEFVSDRCAVDAGSKEASSDLYVAFKQWCEDRGEEPVSDTAFGTSLTEKGFASARSAQKRCRQGLKLLSEDRVDVPEIVAGEHGGSGGGFAPG